MVSRIASNSSSQYLPDFARKRLISLLPRKQFLNLLKGMPEVCQSVFQGFAVKSENLSIPVIEGRLARLFGDDAEICRTALEMWASTSPAVLQETKRQSVRELREQVMVLAEKWGGASVFLALAADERKGARELAEKMAQTLAAIPEPSSQEKEVAPPRPESAAKSDLASGALARLELENKSLRQANAQLKQELAAAEKRIRSLERELDKAARDMLQKERVLDETSKRLSRLEKEMDRAQRARAKAEDESDRLKKQLAKVLTLQERQTQEHTISSTKPPAEKRAEQAPDFSEKRETPVSQADDTISFMSNGLRYNISIKEIIKEVSTNNEANVREFARLAEILRRTDLRKYRELTDSLKKAGRYFVRVLRERLEPVIVDGSNVAHCERDQYGKAKLATILRVREELRSQGFFPIWIYVDASLPHQIDDPAALRRLIEAEEIMMAPAGTPADDIITRKARETGACVVTNDKRLAEAVAPSLQLDTISLVVFNGEVTLRDL